MYLDCPAYLDDHGAARCGLPAEVKRSYSMDSTDGPLDSVMIGCPAGHWWRRPGAGRHSGRGQCCGPVNPVYAFAVGSDGQPQ
jgi:hypothetical protein